ncbi:MAG: cytochrome c [Anaerolineae bacterium]|nr:MAG: cytochrome c [Anaerolineae bacterium]
MKMIYRWPSLILLALVLGLTACEDDSKEAAFTVADLPTERDAEAGKQLFEKGDGDAPACKSCHNTGSEDGATGPGLGGIGGDAGDRVDGESAEEYLLNSIIAPGKHVVEGYRNNMFSKYDDKLSKQQIADLIAYLLTLN